MELFLSPKTKGCISTTSLYGRFITKGIYRISTDLSLILIGIIVNLFL